MYNHKPPKRNEVSAVFWGIAGRRDVSFQFLPISSGKWGKLESDVDELQNSRYPTLEICNRNFKISKNRVRLSKLAKVVSKLAKSSCETFFCLVVFFFFLIFAMSKMKKGPEHLYRGDLKNDIVMKPNYLF